MIIYIDLLFLLNIIYDFILLLTVKIVLKRNISLKRIFLGSLFGGISSFIILFNINKYLLFSLTLLLGFLMVLITYKYKNIKYYLNNCIYLFMCSVILAGFLYFLKIKFNNLSYVFIILLAPLILFIYIWEQKKLKKIINYYRKVIITFKNNKILEINGFIDSGNRLKDPITNKAIILVNKNKIEKVYHIRNPMYVPIKTINKNSLLECISVKNIIIDNKIYNNYLIGLTDNFKNIDDVDCLLNYQILEEENV